MQISLLGPLEVRDGVTSIPLPRRQQRALVAALALRAGEVVSTDRLIDDLWGERPPPSATGSLQNTVAAVRKLVGRDVLVTQPPGYRLAVPREAVDANRFEALVAQARGAPAGERAARLREALALWRGPALADLTEERFARLAAGRLDELRVTAVEERVDADLELGRHAALVGELEQLAVAHPERERLRGQLMLALYRCGRQAEALEVYRATRLALADELGIDPSRELQDLERRMLQQDASLAAPAERDEAVQPEAPSELRLVTVLAAQPPSADDPERHRRLLDETLAVVRAALERHGGSLERFGPEGLVAVFGGDAPSDDDAERAVLAARELGLPAGVATGETVDGAGAVFRRAAELSAGSGIRLDARTAALVTEARRLGTSLVGRSEELTRLRAALAAARESGRCRVLTVLGEPGIGKTRLARELALHEGETTTVLVARCVAHGADATFVPLLGALRRAEPATALAGEDDAELVLARLAALAEGDAPLGESYWAVRRLLEALARRRPLLVVLDDIHWAEPALLDLVEYLGDRVAVPLFVLCLARPELERPLGETLELGPLSAEHTRDVVAAAAELDVATRERVVTAAEGNPLYAEQLAAFAADGGEGLPPTLEAVLAGRLGRLEARDRAVLQRAAVLGRDFTLGGVSALMDADVTRELLALARAGFVHPAATDPADDGYTFHHVLLRDGAYAGVTKAHRAELHERAARWIDRDGPGDDAMAGYHLEQAVRWRRELGEEADDLAETGGRRLGAAAMRVWRTNDVAAAASGLRRATALLPPGRERAELLWEQSIAERLRGLAAADETLASAAADAEAVTAHAVSARVAAERAQHALYAGRIGLDEALSQFERAVAVLRRESDERGLARAEMCVASVHALACNAAEVRAAAIRGALHYSRAGFSAAGCVAQHAEALYYGATPVPEALDEASSLLGASSDRMTDANVTAVIGGLHALEGDHEQAQDLLDRAHDLYEDLGAERALLTLWAPLRVQAQTLAGELDRATLLATTTADLLREADDRAYGSTHATVAADLLLRAGDAERAGRYADAAEADALPSDVLVQFASRAVRARLLARAGRHDEAEELARDAVALASLTDVLCDRARVHLALAEVLEQRGRRAAARKEEAAAARLLRRKGVRGAPVGAPLA